MEVSAVISVEIGAILATTPKYGFAKGEDTAAYGIFKLHDSTQNRKAALRTRNRRRNCAVLPELTGHIENSFNPAQGSDMSRSIALSTMALITFVSACAKSPDAIPPVSMGNTFQGISCPMASRMLNEEHETLATLSKQQKTAAVGDAIGVFLIAVPVSSLTGGDKEGAISTSKGKINALEARLLTCG